MLKSNLTQGSAEWLAFRKTKIGASDAPIIMGVSPWKTPYQLMEYKLGLAENVVNGAMQRGIDKEEEARREFERQTGLIVFPVVAVNPKREWQIASFDGLTLEKDVAVEIKCSGHMDHDAAMSGIVPDHYWPQLQHQMEVGNLSTMFYFSYRNGKGKVIEVKRDQTYIDEVNEAEEDFYEMMQKGEFPQLVESDYIDMRNDKAWEALEKQYLLKSQMAKKAQEEAEQIKEQLKKISGQSNAKGHGLTISKCVCKGGVDYEKIPELQGVNKEEYRKPSFTKWRISSIQESVS